jgi:hypothetical protein
MKIIHSTRRIQAQVLSYPAKALNVLTAQHALAADAVRKPALATSGVLVLNPPIAWVMQNPAATAVHQLGTAAHGVLV